MKINESLYSSAIFYRIKSEGGFLLMGY